MDCRTTWLGLNTFPTEPVGLAYVRYCLFADEESYGTSERASADPRI